MAILQRPWAKQPQWPAELNTEVFGGKPELFWHGASPNYGFTRGSSLTDSVSHAGRGVTFTGNTSNAFTRAGRTAAGNQCTFVSVFRWQSGASNNYPQLCGLSTSNSSFRLCSSAVPGGDLALVKGGVVQLSAVSLVSGQVYVAVASTDTFIGNWYLLVRSLDSGAVTVASGTDVNGASDGNGTYAVGTARTDFSGAWNGDIYLVAADFKVRSLAWGARVAANPWQLFKPLPPRLWVPSFAGSSNTDISAGLGALALTGYAPRADKSVLLSLASASDITTTGATPRVTITY